MFGFIIRNNNEIVKVGEYVNVRQFGFDAVGQSLKRRRCIPNSIFLKRYRPEGPMNAIEGRASTCNWTAWLHAKDNRFQASDSGQEQFSRLTSGNQCMDELSRSSFLQRQSG